MESLLSTSAGFGQAGITVVTLSFAVVFGLASFGKDETFATEGIRTWTRLFTYAAAAVALLWCAAVGYSVTLHYVMVAASVWIVGIAVAIQGALTAFYMVVLVRLILRVTGSV